MVGEFNCILGVGDRVGGNGGGVDISGKELGDMVSIFGLKDMGKGKGYTYFADSGNVKSRIDFCFLS